MPTTDPPRPGRRMTAQKLPPDLIAQVREAAAAEGLTWTAVVEDGLRKYLRAAARRQHQRDVADAVSLDPSSGV